MVWPTRWNISGYYKEQGPPSSEGGPIFVPPNRHSAAESRQSISAASLFFKNLFTLPNGAEPKKPR